jgi:tRNA threonylcarbamoyladenosine biosynthesis protein TsaB
MTDSAGKVPFDQSSFACLAVESATGSGSIAACVGGTTALREYAGHPMQSRDIYAGIREVLDELAIELTDLDCIAQGCGPGAFTGLRITAAVAQALAYGADLSVARISSLGVLAAGAARPPGVDCIAPCFDARMGEAYLAVYSGGLTGEMQNTIPDALVEPGGFRLPAELSFFAAGPGWSACPDLVDNHAAQIAGSDFELVPSAADMLALAAVQFRDGLTVAAAEALPNYIRDRVTD